MEKDTNGKEVFLGLATVRIPRLQRPRNTQRLQTQIIAGSSRDCQLVKDVGCRKELHDSNGMRQSVGIASTSDASIPTGRDNKAFTDEQNGDGKILFSFRHGTLQDY